MNIDIIKTDSSQIDFQNLVRELDFYLSQIDGEEHTFYAQYNKIDTLKNCIVIYCNGEAVSCVAFKKNNSETIEIKRMFTKDFFRGQGFAKMALSLLEKWAKEDGYKISILETGVKQIGAIELYKKAGYNIIPNYEPYENIENSICFKKQFIG